jgi:hypothetical protein
MQYEKENIISRARTASSNNRDIEECNRYIIGTRDLSLCPSKDASMNASFSFLRIGTRDLSLCPTFLFCPYDWGFGG